MEQCVPWNPGEAARTRVNDALQRLSADLAAGQSESLTTYLTAMSRFRHYSWDNVLLISVQRPEATRVAGHHGWHDLGRAVRSGEKGILIFAAPDRDLFRKTGARTTYVFDVSQTSGQPLPKAQFTDGPKTTQEHFERTLARYPMADHAAAEAAAYVAARALGMEHHPPSAGLLRRNATDAAGLAHRLAAIQETTAAMLDELLPEDRARSSIGGHPPLRLDAEAFKDVRLRHGERLVNSLVRLAGSRDEAQEIAARAFEIAWEKRDSFRGSAAPFTWIEAIARNEARRWYWRSERRFDSLDRENAVEPVMVDRAMDDLERREERDQLTLALGQLPEKQRQVLTSHFLDGLSVRDIAQRDNIPVGTVLSRIHSGKQILREAWKSYGAGSKDPESPDPSWSR